MLELWLVVKCNHAVGCCAVAGHKCAVLVDLVDVLVAEIVSVVAAIHHVTVVVVVQVNVTSKHLHIERLLTGDVTPGTHSADLDLQFADLGRHLGQN